MAWLTGWSYRKSHDITGSSGAGANYQIKILVHYGSGSDSGEDVYLNDKCETDFGDVRFTDNDGNTELDYWIETKVDSDVATIWVEVTDDLDDNQTIYIYYGKSAETTTSDGDNTFLFFDHFPGASLDLDKWDVNNGTPVVEDSYVKLGDNAGGTARIETDADFATNHSFRMKTVVVDDAPSSQEVAWGFSNGAGSYRGVFSTYGNGRTLTYESGWESKAWTEVLTEGVTEVQRNGTTSVIFVREGVVVNTHSTQVTSGNTAGKLNSDAYTIIWCDWFLIRKFIVSEPAHSTWGSEEEPAKLSPGSIVPIMEGIGMLQTKRKSIIKPFTSRMPKFSPRVVI